MITVIIVIVVGAAVQGPRSKVQGMGTHSDVSAAADLSGARLVASSPMP